MHTSPPLPRAAATAATTAESNPTTNNFCGVPVAASAHVEVELLAAERVVMLLLLACAPEGIRTFVSLGATTVKVLQERGADGGRWTQYRGSNPAQTTITATRPAAPARRTFGLDLLAAVEMCCAP